MERTPGDWQRLWGHCTADRWWISGDPPDVLDDLLLLGPDSANTVAEAVERIL